MSLPTVASLCTSVPEALAPAHGFAATTDEISAVHISELTDPTGYLSGGELLLTTGLWLETDSVDCGTYVTRLVAAGVSAVGIGLGPSLSSAPAALAAACERQGLCLLIVPPAAAFLTVTKAYWSARTRSSQQELSDAISAHRSLVDAMVSSNPVAQTLKALTRATGSWAALLDPAGTVEHVFPSGRVKTALVVAEQVSALQLAGIGSSATFPVDEEIVAVFPLTLEARLVGHIVIASARPLTPIARRVALTAGALLSLDSLQRRRADAASQAHQKDVSSLLDMGFTDAAHRLASRVGLRALGDTVRVLVVRSARSADVTEAIFRYAPGAMPGQLEADVLWFVVTGSDPDAPRLRRLLLGVDAGLSAALSEPIGLHLLHRARIKLARRVVTLPPGTICVDSDAPADTTRLLDGIHRVLEYRRADLIGTLAAYLRHRGHWDAAARDLELHRNTLRHRMTRIHDLLGADPDDPDVAAEIWLYLRRNGLA